MTHDTDKQKLKRNSWFKLDVYELPISYKTMLVIKSNYQIIIHRASMKQHESLNNRYDQMIQIN